MQKQDIVIQKGETFSMLIEWTDEQGNPIDLTNATGRMDFRAAVGSNKNLTLRLSTEDGGLIFEDGGRITLYVGIDVSEVLKASKGVHDLFVRLPAEEGAVPVGKGVIYGDWQILEKATQYDDDN